MVWAGVDYAAIVEEAEKEAPMIIWDGGNNDFSFLRCDLEIVIVDPFRPGHESAYHPGEVNLRRAGWWSSTRSTARRPRTWCGWCRTSPV